MGKIVAIIVGVILVLIGVSMAFQGGYQIGLG